MKIGIIGYGNIGKELAKAFSDKVVAVYDTKGSGNCQSAEEVIEKADLIIEAAQPSAVEEIVLLCQKKGKKVLVMSIGGLVGKEKLLAYPDLYFPSGAIAGIDGLLAAKEGKIEEVKLTTTKAPESLKEAPYVIKNKIQLDSKKTVFSGKASEAVKGFPQNINVAGLLALKGIGAEKTKVEIICDPEIKVNRHEVLIKGDFGEIKIEINNVPSLSNPKTSYLAVLSAKAKIREILGKE